MTAMSPRKILVTGGAGYVGSALVPRLLEAGHEVTVLDLFLYGDDVLQAVAGNPALEQVKGDIRDRRLLERVMPGCDAVIHLAAENVAGLWTPAKKRRIRETRVHGTRRVAEASTSEADSLWTVAAVWAVCGQASRSKMACASHTRDADISRDKAGAHRRLSAAQAPSAPPPTGGAIFPPRADIPLSRISFDTTGSLSFSVKSWPKA